MKPKTLLFSPQHVAFVEKTKDYVFFNAKRIGQVAACLIQNINGKTVKPIFNDEQKLVSVSEAEGEKVGQVLFESLVDGTTYVFKFKLFDATYNKKTVLKVGFSWFEEVGK